MAGRPSGAKRDRERSKKLKADEKRARRQEAPPPDEDDGGAPVVTVAPAEEIIARIAEIQAAFDDEQMSFDEYEERKAALLAQLVVE